MKPAAALHPSPDCLRLFGTGQLSADEAASVEAHVSDCPDCGGVLRSVADDPFVALVRRATSAHPASRSGDTTPQLVSRLPEASCADSTFPEESPAAPAIVEVPAELREHPRYQVLELLGHGGMGTVYKAEHRLMQRTVALKLLARNLTTRSEMAERFVRETQTAGRLAHANIAQAFDAEQAGDTLFLVMEFVPGTDLARIMRERGPLPCIDACRYIRQAALALQHAHERGMVHRDIKPHNLMLTPDGEIKVLDFGLARFVLAHPLADTSQLTDPGLFMGTADYVAPEQARDAHQADTRADVYSLGCTLYHLLTGQVPFPAKTVMDKVVKHATEEPPPLSALRPDLPAGLEGVVMKMMAKLPGQRYQTPGEVVEALAPFATAVAAVPLAQPGRLGRTGTLIEAELVREPAGALSQTAVLSASGRRSGRERWWRRLLAVAAGFLFVAMALAGVVVYCIQTDKGELVIEAVDDDVEVIVKHGGKLVTIYDPKSKQKLILRSGTYELELKGKPTGLKLDIDSVTLRRGDKPIVKIRKDDKPEIAKVGEVRRSQWGSAVEVFAVSPDGSLALARRSGAASELVLWDLAKWKVVHRLKGHRVALRAAGFSPDGKRIVSCSPWPDPMILIWDVESGQLLHNMQNVGNNLYDVTFSADGRYVFSCGEDDGSVRMWDAETGKEVKRFKGHRWIVSGLIVSPDGRYLVTVGREAPDISVRGWEVKTGKEVQQLKGLTEWANGLAFLPDSKRILVQSADKTLRLFDVVTGKEIRRYGEGNDKDGLPVSSQCVSPDGRRFLTGGPGLTMRLWDVETGKELHSFTGHTARITCADILPDGKFALSGSLDTTMRLWRLPDPPAARDRP
jgi:WD40 repeat protein